VPTQTVWSFPGNPAFTLAEPWIHQAIDSEEHVIDLINRYLHAYGPASCADIQTWSGLSGLKTVMDANLENWVTYHDEKNRVLFDIKEGTIVDGSTPARVRFLPEFDNLLLGYQLRTRIIPKEYHAKVFLAGLRVAATVLVDGFVQGVWKLNRIRGKADIAIELFKPFSTSIVDDITENAREIASFIDPEQPDMPIHITVPQV
jgi:hypothetical protein